MCVETSSMKPTQANAATYRPRRDQTLHGSVGLLPEWPWGLAGFRHPQGDR